MVYILKYIAYNIGHMIYWIWKLYVETLPSITSFKSDSQKYSFLSQLKKSARSCVGQFAYVSKIYFIHVSFLHEPSSDTSLPSESQKDLSTWFETMVSTTLRLGSVHSRLQYSIKVLKKIHFSTIGSYVPQFGEFVHSDNSIWGPSRSRYHEYVPSCTWNWAFTKKFGLKLSGTA